MERVGQVAGCAPAGLVDRDSFHGVSDQSATREDTDMTRDNPDPLKVLREAGTAVISDVFDNLDMEPLALAVDLWPTTGERQRSFAGQAYTVSGIPQEGGQKSDRDKLRAIDEMPKSSVAVWAANGAQGVCCFGDLLATAMMHRGIAGAVVDGGVRDLSFLRDLDLPMMVAYRTPVQGLGRWKVVGCQEPVSVRGAIAESITINPGDIIVADADGVIAVPAAKADQVADLAAGWGSKDQAARDDIENGMKLLDAMDKHGSL
jgi:regulator of RNase E activity RraA